MSDDELIAKLDEMASDFLLLSENEIGIPIAGKFLNQLDAVFSLATERSLTPLIELIPAVSDLLEKLIIDAIKEKDAAFFLVERGISLLQDTAQAVTTGGEAPTKNIETYVNEVHTLTGFQRKAQQPLGIEERDTPPQTSIEPVSSVQDENLLRDFIAEAREYIETIEVNILNLEQHPDDQEIINSIFRPFHSIKGVAGFLNLIEIQNLAHRLENLLDKVRNGTLPVTAPMIDVILEGADTLKTMIGLLHNRVEGNETPRESIDLGPLEARIEMVEKKPTTAANNICEIGEIPLETEDLSEEELDQALKELEATPGEKIGEASITPVLASPGQVSQALRQQSEQSAEASTIRVDTRKLDDLIDMVGELVIAHSIIKQDISRQLATDRNLMRDIAQLSRITASLQQTSTSLRMVPIKQTFQRTARLVRDLARSKGKKIAVQMIGEDTEIDRHMVDEIYNPLVHIIRNSVDHGIETPEERQAVGKSPGGTIVLRAYHRGGNIVIEISDDGRGLDRQKILEKAIRTGRVHAGDDLSEDEINRLICIPGLSTADTVTDVSGRGVGMDVVIKAVEKLRGAIDIKSTPGKGVTLIISFPLTMAIIDGMIVKVGAERYIFPTTAIRQALRPSYDKYTNVVGKGETINVMGHLIPVVRLSDVFGIDAQRKPPWEAISIVVEAQGHTKCFQVDEILGKTEVVIKSLGKALKKVPGIAGGAILGDGQIGLILDVEGLFQLAEAMIG